MVLKLNLNFKKKKKKLKKQAQDLSLKSQKTLAGTQENSSRSSAPSEPLWLASSINKKNCDEKGSPVSLQSFSRSNKFQLHKAEGTTTEARRK